MKRQKNKIRGLNRGLLELLIDLFSQLSVNQSFFGLLTRKKALILKDLLKDALPHRQRDINVPLASQRTDLQSEKGSELILIFNPFYSISNTSTFIR